jgi:hypothetical protein
LAQQLRESGCGLKQEKDQEGRGQPRCPADRCGYHAGREQPGEAHPRPLSGYRLETFTPNDDPAYPHGQRDNDSRSQESEEKPRQKANGGADGGRYPALGSLRQVRQGILQHHGSIFPDWGKGWHML